MNEVGFIGLLVFMSGQTALIFYLIRDRQKSDDRANANETKASDLRERVATRDETIVQYSEKAKDDAHVIDLLEQERDRLRAVVKTQDEQLQAALADIEAHPDPAGLAANLRRSLQDLSSLSRPAPGAAPKNG